MTDLTEFFSSMGVVDGNDVDEGPFSFLYVVGEFGAYAITAENEFMIEQISITGDDMGDLDIPHSTDLGVYRWTGNVVDVEGELEDLYPDFKYIGESQLIFEFPGQTKET